MWSITRLKAAPPLEVLEALGDEGGYEIEDYILDSIQVDQWAVRKAAAATLIHENGGWAEDGMDFGNEGYNALLYTLAAIEVSPTPRKAKPAAKKLVAKPSPAAKLTPAPKQAAAKRKPKPAAKAAKPKAKRAAKAKSAAKATPKPKPKRR